MIKSRQAEQREQVRQCDLAHCELDTGQMRFKAGHGPITPQTENPTPYCVQWGLNWAAVEGESVPMSL